MDYSDTGYLLDQSFIRRLKMRIEADDNFHPKLKKLKVRGKDLNEMPVEIFSLSELEVLEMSPDREACIEYKMPKLPSHVANLINLKILILDTNDLHDLPVQLCQLHNLEELFLSNNHLLKLPDQFTKLAKLENLHLANNNFETFPEAICDLKKLKFLDIGCNELKTIPDKISNLINLHSFILVSNKIERLPESISNLESLTLFWIGHNLITRLPRNISKLSSLDWGSNFNVSMMIDCNPLIDPPIEVCKKGITAIDDYFKQTKRN